MNTQPYYRGRPFSAQVVCSVTFYYFARFLYSSFIPPTSFPKMHRSIRGGRRATSSSLFSCFSCFLQSIRSVFLPSIRSAYSSSQCTLRPNVHKIGALCKPIQWIAMLPMDIRCIFC